MAEEQGNRNFQTRGTRFGTAENRKPAWRFGQPLWTKSMRKERNRRYLRAAVPAAAVVMVISAAAAAAVLSGAAQPASDPVEEAQIFSAETISEFPSEETRSEFSAEEESAVLSAERSPEPSVSEAPPEAAAASAAKEKEWSGREIMILLKIAMAEAEGESVEGKALVMRVVLNRAGSPQFPDTVEEVVFEPKQFSTVEEGGRYYTTEPNEDCYEALLLILDGWDESRGALYFESCGSKNWLSENLDYLFQEGNHRFYQ